MYYIREKLLICAVYSSLPNKRHVFFYLILGEKMGKDQVLALFDRCFLLIFANYPRVFFIP